MSVGDGIRAGMAYVEGVFKDEKMVAGLKRGQAQFRAMAATIKKTGLEMAAAGAAIAGPFVLALNTFRETGASLDDMSKRTGVSVEALSELKFAAEQSGATLENVESGIKAMDRSLLKLESGVPSVANAFAELGLSADDFRGKLPEDQLTMISERIAAIEDPTRRAALAMKVFGGSGQTLLPMIEEVAELREQARQLGFVMSSEAASAAAELDDKLSVLKFAFEATQRAVAEAVVPLAIDFLSALQSVALTATAYIKENQEIVVGVAKLGAALAATGALLLATSTAISTITTIMGGLSAASGVATAAVGALGTALAFVMANPIVLGIAAVGAAVAGIYIYFDEITAKTNEWRNELELLARPGSMLDLLLTLTKIRQLQMDIENGKSKDPPTYKNDDGVEVGGANGSYSNGRTIGGAQDFGAIAGAKINSLIDMVLPQSDRDWFSNWQTEQAKRDATRTPFAQARSGVSQAFGMFMNAPNEAMNAIGDAIGAALHTTDAEREASDLAKRRADMAQSIEDQRQRALIEEMPQGKARDLALIDENERLALRELQESGMFSHELQAAIAGLHNLQRQIVERTNAESHHSITSQGTLRGDIAEQQLSGQTIDDKMWDTQKRMLNQLQQLNEKRDGILVGA